MSKNLMFLFNQGSEIRQFIYSGIIDDLLNDNYNIFISLRVNNNEIQKVFNKKIKLIEFHKYGLPFYINLIEDILKKSDNHYKTWKYSNITKKFKNRTNKIIYFILFYFISLLIKIPILKKNLIKLQTKIYKILKFPEWINTLNQYKIDEIIVTVPNTNFDLLFSAQKLSIPVQLIFHTNKDLYALGKIFYPYSRIGVWNEKMKKDFLFINNTFQHKQVSIVGCSHFSYLSQRDNLNIYQYFNISSKNFIILYIAAAPFVISNEYLYIMLIEETLKKSNIKNYTIIVKTNPMDSTNYWDKVTSKTVKLYKSQWRWDTKEKFNYPYLTELKLFRSLLKETTLSIGLPSTVAIESAIYKVPNLNICFEYKNVKSIYSTILDMWNAPFYENTRKYGAIPLFDITDLEKYLELILSNKDITSKNQSIYLKQEITYPIDILKQTTLNFIKGY